ncbi:hypothetical protein PROSTU_04772 [Providencia stuartii ATCC 25827]|uniref:Uncharacterized protein n=1 Tax=Providencia stuartii ATCC 25827 TaxID=471874 RepID=A0AA87CP21_PROST|nr:hypothetical protein PROSTU_04772 [Providencia stuartii ATCC 25827]
MLNLNLKRLNLSLIKIVPRPKLPMPWARVNQPLDNGVGNSKMSVKVFRQKHRQ